MSNKFIGDLYWLRNLPEVGKPVTRYADDLETIEVEIAKHRATIEAEIARHRATIEALEGEAATLVLKATEAARREWTDAEIREAKRPQ